ncbi:MAG: acyltransferase [Magnetococcales bacterium]|nr:acyltransferase [Magnetococcales bacterium]
MRTIYRPEIDGIRAIAVLSVILFHTGKLLPGGYLGVDIFFVISGYLISSIIILELHDTGNLSLSYFYQRRCRRILPVLSLVVLLSMGVAWFLMDHSQLKAFGLTVLSVSGFVSNFVYWQNSGYFSPSFELLPLMHTWSLAIEEQFYLLFPVLLVFLWRLGQRRFLHFFLFAAFVSLLFAEWSGRPYRAPDAAFFLAPARFWELLAGSILAALEVERGCNHPGTINLNSTVVRASLLQPLDLPGKPEKPTCSAINTLSPAEFRVGKVMPFFGIFMIAFSLIFFGEKEIQHPSFYTLIPVLGVMIIIWFAKPGDPVSNLLASPALVFVGLLSYSLYLWHVPLLAFIRLSNLGELPEGVYYWFFPLLLLLSLISWRFIESPCRNQQRVPTRLFIFSMSGVWTLIILFAFAFWFNDGFIERQGYPDSLRHSFLNSWGYGKCIESEIFPPSKNNYYCEVSSQRKKKVDFILTGDSHAIVSIPAFSSFAEQNGLRGIAATHTTCPPFLGINALNNKNYQANDCSILSDQVYSQVKKYRIPVVFMAASWIYYTNYVPIAEVESDEKHLDKEAYFAIMARGLARTVKKYGEIGSQVIIIGPVPHQRFLPQEIYKAVYRLPKILREEKLNQLSSSVTAYYEQQNEFLKIFTNESSPNFHYLDISKYYCNGERCPVGTLETSYYGDSDHLTIAGIEGLKLMLHEHRDLILDLFQK